MTEDRPGSEPHLVLVGAGHAHVEVLRRFGRRPQPGLRLTLISPGRHTFYSGMLPGCVAGHYRPEQAAIPLAPLARFAGARFIRAEVTGIDPAARWLALSDGGVLHFDLASLDIGAAPDPLSAPAIGDRLLPVKPFGRFLDRWRQIEGRLADRRHARLAVAGAGAGGVEIALAIRHRLTALAATRGAEDRHRIALIERGPEILAGLPQPVRRRFAAILADARIDPLTGVPDVAEVEARDGPFDTVIWAVGGRAPGWLAGTGLALDPAGSVLVETTLRTLSHPAVFAAGDVASMAGHARPKAGVIAVRQGPALAANLRAASEGRAPVPHLPPKRWLSLISTGGRDAVAVRGRLWAEGRWVWRWKDQIDRRFLRRYTALAMPEPVATAEAAPRR